VKNEENSMVLLSLKYLVPRTLGKLNFIIHIMNLNWIHTHFVLSLFKR